MKALMAAVFCALAFLPAHAKPFDETLSWQDVTFDVQAEDGKITITPIDRPH